MSVHVPLRLVIDATSLASRQKELDRGAAKGLSTALANARAEIVERFGDYLAPRLLEPTFAWSGPAVGEVPQALRRQIERRLKQLIPAAGARAGLVRPRSFVRPLSQEPREEFDPSRNLAFGRYLVDSYDSAQVAVDVDRNQHKPPPTPGRRWDPVDIYTVPSAKGVRKRVEEEAKLLGVTLSGNCGILVHNGSDTGWTILMSGDGFKDAELKAANFGQQTRRKVRGFAADGTPIVHEEVIIPSVYLVATATETDLGSDEAEVSDKLMILLGPKIRAEVKDSVDPSKELDDHLLTEAELDAKIEEFVQAEIDLMVKKLLGRSTSLLRISWGDEAFNVGLPSPLGPLIGWDGSPIPIIPVTADTAVPRQLDIGTGGDGTGAGQEGKGGGREQEGRGSQYGTSGDGTGTGSSNQIFPSFGEADPFVCEPYLDAEPGPDALDEGKQLMALVKEIADRLDMLPCDFPATFCIGAAHALAARAAAVGTLSAMAGPGELTMPASARGGNVGKVSFRPSASRGIQLLRRLSQAAAKISELRALVEYTYINGSGRHKLKGEFASNAVGFARRFLEDATPELKQGVGEIFAQTCQLVMLQLLDTSAQQIAARKANIKAYAPLFRDVLVRRLADIGKLRALRDRLREYEAAKLVSETLGQPVTGTVAAIALPGWAAAAHDLANACVATEDFSHAPGAANEIVVEDGVARIRDEHGFLWTRTALESEMVSERGQAESIDPLIEQLSDIPENVERFKQHPDDVEPFLAELLDEMAQHNRDKRMEALFDFRFGLRVGKISEDVVGLQVPGVEVQLAGVHQIAHEQIYPFFGSATQTYADGLNYVIGVELGIQAFEHFATFTGMILLAVICAPAAFVAGVAVAAHEVAKAEGRMDLYKALINPELVLNRAELEMERYIAYVGLALALLPEAGTAARAVSVGVRGAAKKGLGVGLRLVGRSVMRQVSRQVTEQLARDMLPALLHEIATNLLMEQVVVPYVVGPVIAQIEHELALSTSVGGQAGAEKLIEQIEQAAAKSTAAPLPGAIETQGAN